MGCLPSPKNVETGDGFPCLDTQGPVHGFCGMWGVLAAALFDWGKAGRQKILWADVIFQSFFV